MLYKHQTEHAGMFVCVKRVDILPAIKKLMYQTVYK